MKRGTINFSGKHDGEIDLLKGLVAGIAGGLLASLIMEQFQAAWSKISQALKSDENGNETNSDSEKKSKPATVRVAERLSQKIFGREIPDEYKPAAGEAVHYGMGAGSAAVYGVLSEVAPVVTMADGLSFGTGLWFLADEVAVPAAGLSPPPKKIPFTTHVYALTSHLVYGGITEIVRRAVRKAL